MSVGGMKTSKEKRLKEFENENARQKTMVADLILDKEMLKEIAEGNFSAQPGEEK